MSTNGHVATMRETVGNWLNKFDQNSKKQLSIEDLANLVETLGFSAKIVDKPQEKNEDQEPQKQVYLIVNLPKESEETPITPIPIENKEKLETKLLSPTKTIGTPKRSPLQDIEISVNMGNIPTSSPIKQTNKVADVLNKIITLAKEALESVGDANCTYSKPIFLNKHKRISDIRVSPLSLNQSESHLVVDLNVTKTKENPSILKTTPKKKNSIVIKTDDNKKKQNASFNTKRSLAMPQTNLQLVRSKLRTPSQLKGSPSITVTRTSTPITGQRATPTAIPGVVTERRLSTTPLKRETPIGLSRLKHPSVVKK